MQPIWGFTLFLLICAVSALIASKRGNSGMFHFIITLALGFLFTIMAALVTGGQGSTQAAIAGFVGGIVGIALALLRSSDAQQAESAGVSNAHKKCPYCAEVVKIEALKCKHCGSNLSHKSA